MASRMASREWGSRGAVAPGATEPVAPVPAPEPASASVEPVAAERTAEPAPVDIDAALAADYADLLERFTADPGPWFTALAGTARVDTMIPADMKSRLAVFAAQHNTNLRKLFTLAVTALDAAITEFEGRGSRTDDWS